MAVNMGPPRCSLFLWYSEPAVAHMMTRRSPKRRIDQMIRNTCSTPLLQQPPNFKPDAVSLKSGAKLAQHCCTTKKKERPAHVKVQIQPIDPSHCVKIASEERERQTEVWPSTFCSRLAMCREVKRVHVNTLQQDIQCTKDDKPQSRPCDKTACARWVLRRLPRYRRYTACQCRMN